MKQLQDLKQTLEKVEIESQEAINAKRAKVEELDNNIAQLEESYKGRNDRLSYFKGMLASNDQRGSTAASGGRSSQMAKTEGAAAKGGPAKDKSKATISTTALEEPSTTMNRTGMRNQAPQSAFNLHLISMGATREQIKNINSLIQELVEKSDIKGENTSFEQQDKIGLLKKVEIKFHLLAEDRKVFSFFDADKLRAREQKIKQETKLKNNLKIKEKND